MDLGNMSAPQAQTNQQGLIPSERPADVSTTTSSTLLNKLDLARESDKASADYEARQSEIAAQQSAHKLGIKPRQIETAQSVPETEALAPSVPPPIAAAEQAQTIVPNSIDVTDVQLRDINRYDTEMFNISSEISKAETEIKSLEKANMDVSQAIINNSEDIDANKAMAAQNINNAKIKELEGEKAALQARGDTAYRAKTEDVRQNQIAVLSSLDPRFSTDSNLYNSFVQEGAKILGKTPEDIATENTPQTIAALHSLIVSRQGHPQVASVVPVQQPPPQVFDRSVASAVPNNQNQISSHRVAQSNVEDALYQAKNSVEFQDMVEKDPQGAFEGLITIIGSETMKADAYSKKD